MQGERQRGFTLIELSIVLVIIGLIVGGVLAGRSLIRSAELKSIITDEQRYVSAVNTFRTKYNELPGDMLDATNYWGTDPTGCPQGSSTMPLQATCNGNGNGMIEDIQSATGGSVATYENFRAWQQLANVGLIPGAYTGAPGPLSWGSSVPGLNVPATKIPTGGFEWVVFANGGYGQGGAYGPNVQQNTQYLLLGTNIGSAPGPSDNGQWSLVHALLNAADGMAIDQKMDDGFPQTGTVIGSTFCVAYSGSTVTYNTASNSPACSLLFQVKSW